VCGFDHNYKNSAYFVTHYLIPFIYLTLSFSWPWPRLREIGLDLIALASASASTSKLRPRPRPRPRPRCSGLGLGLGLKILASFNISAVYFVVSECLKQLTPAEFYSSRDGSVYCAADYQRLFSVRCHACQLIVEGDVVTVIDHSFHPDCCVCSRCRSLSFSFIRFSAHLV